MRTSPDHRAITFSLTVFIQLCLLPALLFTVLSGSTAKASSTATVAAASSLRLLWPDLMARYMKDTGEPRPRVSFASSGLLSSQIRNGAPFNLFLSADPLLVTTLRQANLTSGKAVPIATGSLVLATPAWSPHTAKLSLQYVADQLRKPTTEPINRSTGFRITLPNPNHAPYGRAARTALQSAQAWPLEGRQWLAAENAAQSLQFVKTGAVDVGLIPRSLITVSENSLHYVDLPASSYQPVEHTMTLLASADTAAEALFKWLQSDAAVQVLTASGLSGPELNKR